MAFVLRSHRHIPFERFCDHALHGGLHMTRRLLITFLLLSSGPVYAEWMTVSIIDQVGATVYVDPATIHRKGDRVTMWELIDYETVQTVTGASFLSARLQHEYDCAGDRHRTFALTKLSGNMGTGKVILITPNEHKWEPVDPGSIARRLWKFACDKK
jgi:hypothetical protein